MFAVANTKPLVRVSAAERYSEDQVISSCKPARMQQDAILGVEHPTTPGRARLGAWMRKFALAVEQLNAALCLPPLNRHVCHKYENGCECVVCAHREKRPVKAVEQPKQPWEKAA